MKRFCVKSSPAPSRNSACSICRTVKSRHSYRCSLMHSDNNTTRFTLELKTKSFCRMIVRLAECWLTAANTRSLWSTLHCYQNTEMLASGPACCKGYWQKHGPQGNRSACMCGKPIRLSTCTSAWDFPSSAINQVISRWFFNRSFDRKPTYYLDYSLGEGPSPWQQSLSRKNSQNI